MLCIQVSKLVQRQSGSAAGPYKRWQVPQCPFSIECAAELLDELGREVESGMHSPRGGQETGGLLFGIADSDCIRIVSQRPIECEHAMGPGFVLSKKDERHLAQLISSAESDPDLSGLQVVGWYHSHISSRIYLSERDRQIHLRYFGEPRQVALVLHPSSERPTRAGFFFREPDGAMRTDSSYEEFPLETAPPAPEITARAAPTTEKPRRHSPEPAAAPPPEPVCPKCGSKHLRRSHRKSLFERVSGLFGYYPYRCHECLSRSLLKRSDILESIRPSSHKRPEERRRAWLRTRREILLWGASIAGFVAILYFLIRDSGPKPDQP
jgi:proteasome lid subunit RPN8/RPN11